VPVDHTLSSIKTNLSPPLMNPIPNSPLVFGLVVTFKITF
jgi:hypothetical protein